jgi:ribonucleoside-diphosphate reductase beta chain
MDRTREALEQMTRENPQLAARLIIQMLPAAAARVPGPLRYDLDVDGIGTWRVAIDGDGADVTRLSGGAGEGDGQVDFRLITDPEGLARMAAGASAARLLLRGRMRIRGKRRRALRLRALANGEDPSIADAIRAGAAIDADAIHRSLEYLVDPEWTRGYRFTVGFHVEGEGTWYVEARDGERLRVTTEPPPDGADVITSVGRDTYRRLLTGELTPTQAMRSQLTKVEGALFPATLLGRWIDRAQGRDDAELVREESQRQVQAVRAGSWGGSGNGRSAPVPAPAAQGDPGMETDGPAERRSGDLMSYQELYALWERQHWAVTPREAQENTTWSLGSFYIGEERVTADLAPFLLAAPSGEVEAFLATQLVDEARHAVFFDRFGAEVMALDSQDLRGRMLEVQQLMQPAWFEVFDDGLRDVAERIKARPGDLGLFVEGITTYHMVIEGVLATTGQRFILKYVEDHDLYPGFQKGFGLVEQDEHRHIAFGVRFLRDAVESDPRYAEIVERTVERLVPPAVHVFKPPYADDVREFVSYGYHSSQIYGYAYRKLKRRMAVLGLSVSPPEDLMPGPVASPEEARAAGAPV